MYKLISFFCLVFMFSCGQNEPNVAAVNAKSNKNAKTALPTKVKKNKGPNYQSIVNRIPINKSGKATRFQIFRMNEVMGEGKLLKAPYMLGNKDLEIVGVAVDDVASSSAHSVYINLNGTYIPTNYGGNSEGFAKTSGNPNYNRSSFRITIPNKKLKKGSNEIKVIVVGNNQKYKFVPQRVYKVFKN